MCCWGVYCVVVGVCDIQLQFFERVLVLLQLLLVGQLTKFRYRVVVCMCLLWIQLLLF